MCIKRSVVVVPRGEGRFDRIEVNCGDCWQCLESKRNDWIGRSLAEGQFSVATAAVTCTYADRDDLAEKLVTKRHFQDFIRALRRGGVHVRYIVAGEYGERKGRAHFHAVLFFKNKVPMWRHRDRDWDDAWPHGHIFTDWNADHKSLRYVLKYALKGENSWFSMSKKPLLGWPFFEAKAHQLFKAGLMPKSFEYRPDAGRPDKVYRMNDTARRDYLLYLADMYDAHGLPIPSMPEHVEEALDRAVRWRRYREEGAPPTRSEKFRAMMRKRLLDSPSEGGALYIER